MDYRVPLGDCDTAAVVRVDAGKEFNKWRASALDSSLVVTDATSLWRAAKNGEFEECRNPVRLDETNVDGVVSARIIVQRARTSGTDEP